MKTYTKTFRANAFKALRAQGVSSVKSRAIVTMLADYFRLSGQRVIADGIEIKVSISDATHQRVGLVKGKAVVYEIDAWSLRDLQPLLNCTPTERQVEIGGLLSDMIPEIYAAIGDAGQAHDAEFGYPEGGFESDGWKAREAFIQAFPAVAAVNARYDALKAESLAINPRVPAVLVDPDTTSHWYEWHHDLYHYRPDGFMTLAMVEAEMAHMKDVPMDAYDEAA